MILVFRWRYQDVIIIYDDHDQAVYLRSARLAESDTEGWYSSPFHELIIPAKTYFVQMMSARDEQLALLHSQIGPPDVTFLCKISI